MSKIEYKYPLDVLVSNVFKMFHILWENGSLYADESIPLVLLVLSMYKDDLIKSESMGNHDSVEDFRKTLVRLSNDPKYHESYGPVVDVLSDELSKINSTCLTRICYTLCELDKTFLKKEFISVFDDVLYRYSKSQGKKSGESLQPAEISHLILSLTDFEKTIKVFNPFAGVASYGVLAKGPIQYYGQEKNAKTWAIGTLRIMAYGRKNSLNYVCEDSISNWPQDEKYDLIISTPPFGLRLGPEYKEIKSEYGTIEAFYLKKGFDSLTEDGKLLALFPENFLYNDIHKEVRKELVENDLIESIVTLPGGLLSNTSISTTVVVLNKKKKKLSRKVKLVNGHYFLQANKYGEKKIDYLSIVNLVKNDEYIDQYARIVDSTLIKDNEYNLSIPRYFRKQIYGVKLGELLEIVNGSRDNIPNKGKLVKISDLKDDKLDFTLDLQSIETAELIHNDVNCISESCIIVAARWKTLKQTLFEYNGESIYINKDILAFRIYETFVDKEYLINELHANYVKEQLESIRTGLTIPFIRKEDLLQVIIALPTLVEQRAKVNGAKQAFKQAKEDEIKLHRELNDIKEDTFKEFASIKHTFRQYLSALKSNVVGTRKYLHKKHGQPISLDDIYSVNLNQTLSGHLKSIEETIDAFAKLLESDLSGTSSSDKASFNLIELVNIAHQRLYQDLFKFEIEIDEESFYSEKQTLSPFIEIDKEDFIKMYSNIVSNAIHHGFKNSEGNIIRSNISYDALHEQCVLKVSNNGIPLPDRFTIKRLTTRGEKTTDSKGTGIGGADIKNIVSKYNGTFNLVNDASSLFPVTYEISFPIIKIIKEDEI